MDDKPTQPMKPLVVELEEGTHKACSCKKSKIFPLCDGTHEGTEFKPLLFEIHRTTGVALCHCGLTNNFPYCEASHKKLPAE